MTARSTGLFTMKTTRNNFNVTWTRYRNGVKIDNFVFILINVRLYVLPMREILLAILASYLAVRFSLSPKLLIWGYHWLLIYPGTPKHRQLWIEPTRLWVFLKGMSVRETSLFSSVQGLIVIPILEYAVLSLYKFLVIPILEYIVPLWSPYLQKNIDALERVQRRASKYALRMSSRDSPYEERLTMLRCHRSIVNHRGPVSNQGGLIYPC